MTSKEFKKILINTAEKPAAGKTFQDIIKDSDPLGFLRAIVDFGNWPALNLISEVEKTPQERQLVVLINAFSLAIDSGGIEQLVTDSETGALFDQLLTCCKTIEANRAVEYLQKMASLFPDARVTDDESMRIKLIASIKIRENIKNFRALNREFSSAVPEAIEALRCFIVKNQDRFESVLSYAK